MMAGIRLRVIANDKSEITSQNTCQLNFESPNRFPGKAPGPGSRFWGGEYLIRKYYVNEADAASLPGAWGTQEGLFHKLS